MQRTSFCSPAESSSSVPLRLVHGPPRPCSATLTETSSSFNGHERVAGSERLSQELVGLPIVAWYRAAETGEPRFGGRASLEDVELPMAPVCALEESGLRLQLERYRQVGRDAFLIERTPRQLVAELGEDVDGELVEQAITVERACCPFFALSWDRDRRRLTVSVSQTEHEPALDAIAFALDLQPPATPTPPD